MKILILKILPKAPAEDNCGKIRVPPDGAMERQFGCWQSIDLTTTFGFPTNRQLFNIT
jgi:hypothetical protein